MFLQKNRKVLEIRDCSSLPLNLFGNIEQICVITINNNPICTGPELFQDRVWIWRPHWRAAPGPIAALPGRCSGPRHIPVPQLRSPRRSLPQPWRPASDGSPARNARPDSDQPWETELLGEAFWGFFTSAQLGFNILVTGARNKLTFSLPICHTVAQRSGAAPRTPAAIYCKRMSLANESPRPGPHILQVIRKSRSLLQGKPQCVFKVIANSLTANAPV